jgi:hypothetical protein
LAWLGLAWLGLGLSLVVMVVRPGGFGKGGLYQKFHAILIRRN